MGTMIVKFQVLRLGLMKIQVFWDTMPCQLTNCY